MAFDYILHNDITTILSVKRAIYVFELNGGIFRKILMWRVSISYLVHAIRLSGVRAGRASRQL